MKVDWLTLMIIKKDIGFWNPGGVYIPDVQEIGAEEMDKNFNEFFDELNDMANFKNFGEAIKDKEFIDNPVVAYEKLQQENADLKKYIERMDKPVVEVVDADIALENAELKAENEKLKEEVETRDNLVEHFRKEAINWAKISNDCIKDIEKYKQTLQEIKAIATGVRSYLEVPAPRDVRYEMDRVLDLITKAESEG